VVEHIGGETAMTPQFLRERAADYRRLANAAEDEHVKASYLLLAEIDEEEATELEREDGR
jgi:hypothetical protein